MVHTRTHQCRDELAGSTKRVIRMHGDNDSSSRVGARDPNLSVKASLTNQACLSQMNGQVDVISLSLSLFFTFTLSETETRFPVI